MVVYVEDMNAILPTHRKMILCRTNGRRYTLAGKSQLVGARHVRKVHVCLQYEQLIPRIVRSMAPRGQHRDDAERGMAIPGG